jgi:hypothetical protein
MVDIEIDCDLRVNDIFCATEEILVWLSAAEYLAAANSVVFVCVFSLPKTYFRYGTGRHLILQLTVNLI